MKAFIVLALVAATAARSLDVDTLRWKGLTTKDDLLKEKFLGDSWLSHKWNVPRKSFEFGKSFYPYSDVTTNDFDTTSVHPWTGHRVTILTIDEIVSHPLFEVYYRLPYFRQYWNQYPTFFKNYIESPLFQQFWTQPEFQQYFVNPVLFYKYVVPQVQLFARVEPFGRYYNTEAYGDRNVVVGDYVNRIFDPTYTTRQSRYNFPYVYNYNNKYDTEVPTPYTTTFWPRTNEYKVLLDKMYRTLFVNKPTVGETTEVFTDVKVAPVHKEIVVDPITGEKKVAVVETPKIVDVKVDQKVVPTSNVLSYRTPFVQDEVDTEKVVKETFLKRLLINKTITPELYTVLKTLPFYHVKELVHRIAPSSYDYDFGSDVYNYNVDPFDTDVNDVFYRHKVNPIVAKLWNKDVTGDRYEVVLRDLLKVLGHRNIQY